MSAPLVVNTADGTVWTRREQTLDGAALYAVAGAAPGAPADLLVPYAELEAMGIAGSADVLPVPVGLASLADPVAAGRCLDLLALMDARAASVVSPVLAAVLDEAERLRARVAELEAARAEVLRTEATNLRRIEREGIPHGATGTRTGVLKAALILDERAEDLLAGQRKQTGGAPC